MCSHTLAAAETADCLKEFLHWSFFICSQVLQPRNNAVANVPASHVVPDHSPAWYSHPIHLHMQPSINLGNAENSPFAYNYPFAKTTTRTLPCFPGQGPDAPENMQVYHPQRPKPPTVIFAFALLSFLASTK